jgi:hypothetical protein
VNVLEVMALQSNVVVVGVWILGHEGRQSRVCFNFFHAAIH